MQKRSIDWVGLQTLEAFLEAGSFAAAARVLGVTHTTVARRLSALEQAAGGPLFQRRAGEVELTARGQLALTCARRMADAALTLQRRLDGREPTELGTVRVACTPALGSALLAPRLPALTARHPQLSVELATDHRALSLARRDADVAVRFARPKAGDLVTRRVGRLDYAVHGLPEVIARWRVDPGTCPFIGYDDGVPEIPETLWVARHIRREQLVLRSNDLLVQRAAAMAGVGVALLPTYLAGGGLAGAGPVLAREIWLVYHRDLRHLPRVRAAVDWLTACFADAPSLAGNAHERSETREY